MLVAFGLLRLGRLVRFVSHSVMTGFLIWNTGNVARLSIVVTFLASLVLSIPLAVGIGVGLAVVLFVASASADVAVRALVATEEGRFAEADPPERLPSKSVTVLDVYGSLFFAGARTLASRLPSPDRSTRPVVLLRVRGRTEVGSTLIDVLDEYADDLAAVGGRLYLSGVDDRLATRLRRVHKPDLEDTVHLVPADAVLGDSTRRALHDAVAWLSEASGDEEAEEA